jgi:deoxyribonuclease V
MDDRLPDVRRVAGADVAFDLKRSLAVAGIVLFSYPDLQEIERASAVVPLAFPYVPGLLSFREIPALLQAFSALRQEADLVFCDAQGYAHPRRFGMASHLGVLLDCPAVGCAKSRLLGTHRVPARPAGSWAPLRDSGEIIGAVLRTRDATNPLFISAGHRISLASSIDWVLRVCDGCRIPKPTREADHFVGQLKQEL